MTVILRQPIGPFSSATVGGGSMLTDAASLWPDSRIADFIADFLHSF